MANIPTDERSPASRLARFWKWLTEETPEQREYRIRMARAGMELDKAIAKEWREMPW